MVRVQKSIHPTLLAGKGGLGCCAERRHPLYLVLEVWKDGRRKLNWLVTLFSIFFNYLSLINGDCV